VTATAVAYLDAIAPEVEVLRKLRYEPDERFTDAPDEALANAARWLRAASYSALEGARKLERIVRSREAERVEASTATPPPEFKEAF
jgi:hypothetical protein